MRNKNSNKFKRYTVIVKIIAVELPEGKSVKNGHILKERNLKNLIQDKFR